MRIPIRIKAIFVLALAAAWLTPSQAQANARPDFSGSWKQDGAHSLPARTGEVTLHIEQHDPDLIVETTANRPAHPSEHAVQHYTTDGKESVTTGADGDIFHTKITWKDQALVFAIVEREDGRVIDSTELWSLTDGGKTLKRVRHSAKTNGEQTILYTRSK